MIFLDTDVISYYYNNDERIKTKLFEAIDNDEIICITTMNIYEVFKGLKWRSNKQFEKDFLDFIEDKPVFPLDDYAINIATEIYAGLRRKGITIGDVDIFIAAIVIANNGTLVTNNTKHFESIEHLKVVNWV